MGLILCYWGHIRVLIALGYKYYSESQKRLKTRNKRDLTQCIL